MFHFMERESKIKSGKKLAIKLNGHVEFRNVYFTYPTRPNVPVLTGFKMEMQPGHVTALVGASGSGKSTIASLLMRFYDPNKGQVLVDEVDIRTYELESYHDNVMAVLQNPQLFDVSMKENITYGVRRTVTQEEVESAAKRARIHSFISELPDGYDTRAGEAGTRLSGGQRQRIAIARAFIAKPRILILDEATSSLDAKNEALVHGAMSEVLSEVKSSVLVIAHRLSTIRSADEIICLDSGKVIERGTHHQLLKKENGYYSALLKKQLPSINSW
eukprot:jgi/Bigna1/58618/fgenesh1_pm.128_\